MRLGLRHGRLHVDLRSRSLGDALADRCGFQFGQLADDLFERVVDGFQGFLVALVGALGGGAHGGEAALQRLDLGRACQRDLLRAGRHDLLRHAVGSTLGHLFRPLALLLHRIEELVHGALDRLERTQLLLGAAQALRDFGEAFLDFGGVIGATIGNGFAELVVEFGDAAFQFGELRHRPGCGLRLFEALGDVEDAAVHFRQRAKIGALRHAGRQLFDGVAEFQHFGSGRRARIRFVDAAVEALDLVAHALDFSGAGGVARKRSLGFLEEAEDAVLDRPQFLLAGLHGLGLRLGCKMLGVLAHLVDALGEIGDLTAQQIGERLVRGRVLAALEALGEIGNARFKRGQRRRLAGEVIVLRRLRLAAQLRDALLQGAEGFAVALLARLHVLDDAAHRLLHGLEALRFLDAALRTRCIELAAEAGETFVDRGERFDRVAFIVLDALEDALDHGVIGLRCGNTRGGGLFAERQAGKLFGDVFKALGGTVDGAAGR